MALTGRPDAVRSAAKNVNRRVSASGHRADATTGVTWRLAVVVSLSWHIIVLLLLLLLMVMMMILYRLSGYQCVGEECSVRAVL